MTSFFYKFFVSFDAFGTPIGVNWKGKQSYNTAVGALFTIAIKIFLMVYAGTKCLQLVSYQDPQISQFTLFRPRLGEDPINLGESLASLAFILTTKDTNSVAPDPRYITFNIMLAKNDMYYKSEMIKQGQLEMVRKGVRDDFFVEGSYVDKMAR